MSRLDRFKRAQDDRHAGFESALGEIRSGGKRGHWIWYVFPQLDGLGMSSTAREYAIHGEAEAAAYLRDRQLRARLLSITRAVAEQLPAGGSASGGKMLRLSTLMGSEIEKACVVADALRGSRETIGGGGRCGERRCRGVRLDGQHRRWDTDPRVVSGLSTVCLYTPVAWHRRRAVAEGCSYRGRRTFVTTYSPTAVQTPKLAV
jgi:hypothetical protein